MKKTNRKAGKHVDRRAFILSEGHASVTVDQSELSFCGCGGDRIGLSLWISSRISSSNGEVKQHKEIVRQINLLRSFLDDAEHNAGVNLANRKAGL